MVRHLIAEYPHQATEPTQKLNETPHFYILSKLKDQSQTEKLKMATLFTKVADFGHRNKNGQTCIEAYADKHGIDEAANYFEN